MMCGKRREETPTCDPVPEQEAVTGTTKEMFMVVMAILLGVFLVIGAIFSLLQALGSGRSPACISYVIKMCPIIDRHPPSVITFTHRENCKKKSIIILKTPPSPLCGGIILESPAGVLIE